MTASATGRWVVRPRTVEGAGLRVLCIAYAGGGSAVFNSWPDGLPADVEICAVQLPGRGSRMLQRPFTRTTDLIPVLGEKAAPYLDGPFVLFGHSMGALISFELARWLRANGLNQPLHLFVSARRAPQLPHDHPTVHELSDARLVEELRRLGGTPEELLADERALRLLLPGIRADFELNDCYGYRPEPALECPITAYGGRGDDRVDIEGLSAWREQTSGPFDLRLFDGGHFFIHSAQGPLLSAFREDLRRVMAPVRTQTPQGSPSPCPAAPRPPQRALDA
ncbi:thioesterase II family protein [Nocardiopsis sp. LOL_012]|uniref:thioesterase II family protein n=1 Tax=Nocardiopsis sp. LOL_012 TaxID=3345409 RepID=UPI003A84BC1E